LSNAVTPDTAYDGCSLQLGRDMADTQQTVIRAAQLWQAR